MHSKFGGYTLTNTEKMRELPTSSIFDYSFEIQMEIVLFYPLHKFASADAIFALFEISLLSISMYLILSS